MKKRLTKIMIGLTLFFLAIILEVELHWLNPVLFIISYIIVGGDIVLKAIRNIFRGKIFDENFLMTIATIGAFFIGEFPEAVAVMLFYQVGELFQSYAVDKSRKSITKLMEIRPDFANIEKDNTVIKVEPEDVKVDDIIIVRPGEKIPLDGIVIKGESMIDTSCLTGEAIPRKVKAGNEILSGCVNQNGVLKIQVTKEFEESTVSKILELVENASSKKSKSENFISKFARYYTPIVVLLALLLAIIPPLMIPGALFSDWIYRALTFLVVSCPCALVISIPLGFFGGIGGASKLGVLVKGGNYLEALSDTEIVVFDKTGTLTKGVFEVQKIEAKNIDKDELLRIVAHCEYYSTHPIAMSVKKAYKGDFDLASISDIEEIAGHGIGAKFEDKQVFVGNGKLMRAKEIAYQSAKEVGTILYVAIDGKFVGYLFISDELKKDSQRTITELKQNHVKKIVMLTGDRKEAGEDVAKQLGIDEVYTELLPDGKVEKLEELLTTKSKKGKLAFVGDGINDSPVLALSDIGIAMGGLGSDAAIEAADIVIMTDEPSKIGKAIKLSKKTLRIVKQNIYFALIVKVGVLILTAFGLSTMWGAVFADVGVSVLAILNALRMLYVKNI